MSQEQWQQPKQPITVIHLTIAASNLFTTCDEKHTSMIFWSVYMLHYAAVA